MSLLRCPICDKLFESEQSPAMPFCCHRCRLIDLKYWLDEDYGLVREPEEEAEDTGSEE
jgi:endogenous inhibitor of DNA gyrase (YacG/DUF329 family)